MTAATTPGAAVRHIEAVVFDFGRVISGQKPPSLFRRYEDELGLGPGTINHIMFDSPHWQRALVGEINMHTFWQLIGPALNLDDAAACIAFRDRYYADEVLDEAVAALIRRLRPRYRLAVLSNHPPDLAAWLADWRLDDAFDAVVCSGDVGVAKPQPAAFRIVLDRLGVEPERAVFIDDDPGHVAAARATGMHGVHFVDAARLERELARVGVR